MKFLVPKVFALLGGLCLASFSQATTNTIGQYNLLLIEDYNFSGGDVQGQTFIGGDLNAAGRAVEFGSRLANTDTAIDAVTIVGDATANQVRVLRDNNLVYGGSLNVSHVELNDGDDGAAIHDPSVSIDDLVSELHADSAYFAGLASTGSYNSGVFDYTGSGSEAVFNVSASDIFARNNSLSLNWGSAETVIINVSGSDIDIGGGVNLTSGFTDASVFSNILWNFYDATSIDFNGLAMKGSVLAPYAHTTGGASFDGAFAALSYTGDREFHNFVFNYDRPPTSIPEPSTLSLMALVLLGGLYRRRKI